MFTDVMIDTLRTEYARIARVDPCGPAYAKMTALLDKASQEQLKQLATAQPRINFISLLAANRLNRKG